MSIFKRLFNIGSAEAHSALDKLEDPVKMTEQGIRELKGQLNESLKGLAEVKASAIRSRKELNELKRTASGYEQKAILLLKKAEEGQVDTSEADRLATSALTKKEQQVSRIQVQQQLVAKQEASVSKMQQNVSRLKQQIDTWETEAKTLKARAKVSEATAKLNKQIANIDSSSTIGLLERMKEKVEKQEALAEGYGEIANDNKSLDDEIDQALLQGGSSPTAQSESLRALKAKIGLLKEGE